MSSNAEPGIEVDRAEFEQPGKPLQPELWAGAVDTAGGEISPAMRARL